MPLSVRLDADTERVLGRLAKKRKQTKSEIVRDAIGLLARQEQGVDGTQRPYDRIAHLIGCVDSGGARLSERTGEKFTALLRARERERRSR